eukprot:540742-Prymnesium_polylepis.1
MSTFLQKLSVAEREELEYLKQEFAEIQTVASGVYKQALDKGEQAPGAADGRRLQAASRGADEEGGRVEGGLRCLEGQGRRESVHRARRPRGAGRSRENPEEEAGWGDVDGGAGRRSVR